jgi:hypothetical protein
MPAKFRPASSVFVKKTIENMVLGHYNSSFAGSEGKYR